MSDERIVKWRDCRVRFKTDADLLLFKLVLNSEMSVISLDYLGMGLGSFSSWSDKFVKLTKVISYKTQKTKTLWINDEAAGLLYLPVRNKTVFKARPCFEAINEATVQKSKLFIEYLKDTPDELLPS